MRILERCTAAWPMPDTQKRVDALRNAYSADPSKPFALKPGFPNSSSDPAAQSRQSQCAPRSSLFVPNFGCLGQQATGPQAAVQHFQHFQASHTQPVSLVSAGLVDEHDSPGAAQSLIMTQGPQAAWLRQTLPLAEGYDPSRAFGYTPTNPRAPDLC